jgi:hypothetical protein
MARTRTAPTRRRSRSVDVGCRFDAFDSDPEIRAIRLRLPSVAVLPAPVAQPETETPVLTEGY